jgi:cytidylate kinase
MKNYVITIARGFGSGGKALAMQLAVELGISCYENRILVFASQITGKETTELIEIDENLRGGYLLNKLRGLPRTTEPKAVEKKFESDAEIFQCQCDIIKKLAETESCIIVGKCADYVLKDYDNVLSFYVEAPRAYCLKRITKRMHVNEEEAAKLIEKTDRYRADYYKFYTNGNYWTNPVNYDMTFNMDRVGEDKCIEVIKNYIKLKFPQDNLGGEKAESRNLYSFVKD